MWDCLRRDPKPSIQTKENRRGAYSRRGVSHRENLRGLYSQGVVSHRQKLWEKKLLFYEARSGMREDLEGACRILTGLLQVGYFEVR